jgi:23S rRNA (pseudouridine1915-N3)-methyltransferase
MGYRVKIFCVGRPHLPYLKIWLESYEKRLFGLCSIEWIIVKSDDELKKRLIKVPYVCLDVLGEIHTSESFSRWIERSSSWNFVIGGATGLPKSVLEGAEESISLSKLTFPHEMVRLLLMEQLYRAFEINKGSPYHK